MTFAVLPNMGRAWQAFEKTPFAELTCTRCHGADAEAASYKMPNRLPPLDPARLPSRDAKDPKEARMARFMFDEVVPQMTELLDAEPYDAKTGRGFFCFDCHPKVKP